MKPVVAKPLPEPPVELTPIRGERPASQPTLQAALQPAAEPAVPEADAPPPWTGLVAAADKDELWSCATEPPPSHTLVTLPVPKADAEPPQAAAGPKAAAASACPAKARDQEEPSPCTVRRWPVAGPLPTPPLDPDTPQRGRTLHREASPVQRGQRHEGGSSMSSELVASLRQQIRQDLLSMFSEERQHFQETLCCWQEKAAEHQEVMRQMLEDHRALLGIPLPVSSEGAHEKADRKSVV